MVRRRTAEAGLKLGCHVFRATGITAYLDAAGGTLENAQAMAAHEPAHDQALRPHRR
jgi:hypothetical protein